VRAAHADAWEVEGRARERFGGGASRVPGARLMSSGIAHAKWNNADITHQCVDTAAIRRWYEPRQVPWGVRVPVEFELDLGEPLYVKRCVALLRSERPRVDHAGITIRRERDASAFAVVEAAAFDYDGAAAAEWVGPQFTHHAFRHWVASVDCAPAAIGTTVCTDGDAGPAAYLTGLALVRDAEAEALRALVDVAVADAFASGCAFVHANPATAEDDETLAGFDVAEVPGYLVRVCEI
jgi:hypothetical protein